MTGNMNKPKRRTYIKRYGCDHTERYITAIHIYIKKLEKALDKACEILEDGYGEELASYEYFPDIDSMIKIPYGMDNKQWKEWLMKDETER